MFALVILLLPVTIPPPSTLSKRISEHLAFLKLKFAVLDPNLSIEKKIIAVDDCISELCEIDDFNQLNNEMKHKVIISILLQEKLFYNCWVCQVEYNACRAAGGSYVGCNINYWTCLLGCGGDSDGGDFGGGSSGGGGDDSKW